MYTLRKNKEKRTFFGVSVFLSVRIAAYFYVCFTVRNKAV